MTPRLFNNIVVLLTALLLLGGGVPSLTAKEIKRVLILYSQEKGHPAHDQTEQGIHAAFLSNSSFNVQLYTEYLDVGRFPGPNSTSAFADYLRRKYAGLEINVIIAVYPHAVDFLLAERRTLFPGAPDCRL